MKKIILRKNGIKTRYYALDKKTKKITHSNADMTANAVKKLFDDYFKCEDIECLVCGTASPDQFVPSHAVMVHSKIGNPPCDIASLSGVPFNKQGI